jgi:ribose/xylose/arabinose/galactoside ABC-type transport system permease subunit
MDMKSRQYISYISAIALIAVLPLVGATYANAATASKSATGAQGQVLTVSKVSAIKSGDTLVVTGKSFDTTVGIYVELCKVVPASQLPDPCGGGVNKSGASAASYWISSNPPSYGRGLAIAYGAGGTFNVKLKVSPLIGKVDCRSTPCAVYVRADHLRTQDRTHDLFVPVNFSK